MKQTDQPIALRMNIDEAKTAQANCWKKDKTDNKANAEEL
jgi:hypothetical protein